MSDKEQHVHFSGGCGLGKDNNIMIQPQRHGHIDAHLGFLQLYHRYHVEFSVPWNLCIDSDEKPSSPAVVVGMTNVNCRVVEFSLDKDNLRLKVELLAYKETILKEKIELTCCDSGAPLEITVKARVLGKDKGTPLLRNGVRSIGYEANNDDVSD